MAIPIAVSIASWMLEDRLSAAAAARMAAIEYRAFVDLRDQDIRSLALELGMTTDVPYWDWLTILRHARDYAVSRPQPDLPADGHDGNGEKKDRIPTWFWVVAIIAVGALIMEGAK